MTIQEAQAVNVLLDHILGKGRYSLDERYGSLDEPSGDEVRQAAELLSEKAYKALYAGWSPEEAVEAWKRSRASRER